MEDTSAMEARQEPPVVLDEPAKEAVMEAVMEADGGDEWGTREDKEEEDEDEENGGLRIASAEPARDNDRDNGEDEEDERAEISFGSDDEAGPADASRNDGAGASASTSQPLDDAVKTKGHSQRVTIEKELLDQPSLRGNKYMHIESKPFEADVYRADVTGNGPESAVPELERLRHTVRWRRGPEDDEGEQQKESNARIVRWSNGSMSLMIGKHYFQVSETDMGGDRTYLYAAQQTAETLEAQARLGSRLVFSMHGQKTAVAKHTIAASAADEANVQLIATREDPARRAEQLRRVEMEVERAQRRLESKQREIDAGNNRHLSRDALEVDRADRLARRQARAAAAPAVRRPAAPRQRVRDDDDEDDEDDGEEEDDSFIATDDDEEEDNDGASDDNEEDEDEQTPVRPTKTKRTQRASSGDGGGADDGDDGDGLVRTKRSKKAAILEDDDD